MSRVHITSSPYIIQTIAAISLIGMLQPATAIKEKIDIGTPYNEILLGTGSSIKGFGETKQTVYSLDIIWRHRRPLSAIDYGIIQGARHLCIEAPLTLISDSDQNDSHDFGIVGINFLEVWVFPKIKNEEIYLLAGGGPRYVMADIAGVGADICGNYQFGIGIRHQETAKRPLNLELRYDHISNLDMANPNIPLNSIKLLFGTQF